MNDQFNAVKINCACFTKKYNQILDNKQKINRSVRGIEKAIYAEDCEENINELLDCNNYDPLNMDCLGCRDEAENLLKSTKTIIQFKASA